MSIAKAICFMLLAHLIVFADSRARFSDGRRMLISSAIMPMTTRSSTSVNAERPVFDERFIPILQPNQAYCDMNQPDFRTGAAGFNTLEF